MVTFLLGEVEVFFISVCCLLLHNLRRIHHLQGTFFRPAEGGDTPLMCISNFKNKCHCISLRSLPYHSSAVCTSYCLYGLHSLNWLQRLLLPSCFCYAHIKVQSSYSYIAPRNLRALRKILECISVAVSWWRRSTLSMEGLNLILLLCTGLFAFGNTFSQDSDAGKISRL